jgi:PPOX class probable F420-dependent enzyme
LRLSKSRNFPETIRRGVVKKRDQIKLSEREIADFLGEQRVINVSTIGRDGWPHITALWYVIRDSEPWIYTYAKSQKVRNLERDNRATLLVESGHEYQELRGVMLKTNAEIHSDIETVASVAEQLFKRYQGDRDIAIDDATREALRAQAAKRVAIQFRVAETASWDHAKLGGAY